MSAPDSFELDIQEQDDLRHRWAMSREVLNAWLCISAGKQVLAAMMEVDRVALCGPKGVPDVDRRAVRAGSTRSAVVLGGQRIGVKRPRARGVDAGELELPSFAWANDTDPLNAATMAAIAAGVSMRARSAAVV